MDDSLRIYNLQFGEQAFNELARIVLDSAYFGCSAHTGTVDHAAQRCVRLRRPRDGTFYGSFDVLHLRDIDLEEFDARSEFGEEGFVLVEVEHGHVGTCPMEVVHGREAEA